MSLDILTNSQEYSNLTSQNLRERVENLHKKILGELPTKQSAEEFSENVTSLLQKIEEKSP
jgi:hypothetical protein